MNKRKLMIMLLLSFALTEIKAQEGLTSLVQSDKKNIISIVVDDKCDNMILKNGNEIKGKVTEITLDEIKYKKCDNLEGPTISIAKKDVFMIQYANGETEVIKAKKDEEQPKQNSNAINKVDYTKNYQSYKDSIKLNKIKHIHDNIYGKDIFSINIVPLVFKDINVSYERFFAKQKLSVQIPFHFGYSSGGLLKNDSSHFEYFVPYKNFKNASYKILNGYSIGLHLNYYPTGEGKIRGFAGLGVEMGSFKIQQKSNYSSNYYNNYVYVNTSNFIGGTNYGGVRYQPNKFLTCSLDMGVAYSGYYISSFKQINFVEKILIRIGATVGIRF